MDLLTLLSVCSLGFDPKLMHGIAIQQSGGKPYVYKMEERIVEFDTPKAVIAVARTRQEEGKSIRIGLMGADIDLLAATADPNEAMFEPCVNVNLASRKLASFKEICKRNGIESAESCAIMSYMGGGYEEQDDTHLDFIMAGAITGNLPNPEIKGSGSESSAKQIAKNSEKIDIGPLFFDKKEDEKEADAALAKKKNSSLFFD